MSRLSLTALLQAVPRPWRGVVLPAAAGALWAAAAAGEWSRSPLLVAPAEVWTQAVAQWHSGALGEALGASLQRGALGAALGITVGAVVGGALGLSRWAERLVGPSFHALKQISLFAWIPLISVWFGLGEASKVVFIALAACFPVALNTIEGVRSVPAELLEVGRVLRLGPLQRLRHLVLPSAAPSLLAGLHLALIYAWLATLGAEYLLSSGEGIGHLLSDGREQFRMDWVLLGVLVVGVVGHAVNQGALWLERRALRWRPRAPAG